MKKYLEEKQKDLKKYKGMLTFDILMIIFTVFFGVLIGVSTGNFIYSLLMLTPFGISIQMLYETLDYIKYIKRRIKELEIQLYEKNS